MLNKLNKSTEALQFRYLVQIDISPSSPNRNNKSQLMECIKHCDTIKMLITSRGIDKSGLQGYYAGNHGTKEVSKSKQTT